MALFNPAYLCAQSVQPCINLLVTTVDLVDILDHTFPFRAHRSNEQGNAGTDIRARHGNATELAFPFEANHNCPVWVTQRDLCTHFYEFIYKEQAALKHF